MIDTRPMSQAVRSNEPRAVFVAAENLYRNAKASTATLRVPELAPLPASAPVKRTKSYIRHLTTKVRIAIGTIFVSLVVAWISASNLLLFFTHGTYWFHPLISINLLIASIGLILVAVVVIHTVGRYVQEFVAGS